MIIFGLAPYSKTSTTQIVPWHFVLFDKWFNTHRRFPWKWETSLTYVKPDNVFYFHCYWLKPNSYDDTDPYRFSKIFIPFWNRDWR